MKTRYAIADADDETCVMIGDGSMASDGLRARPGYEMVSLLRAGWGDDVTDYSGRELELAPDAIIYHRDRVCFCRVRDIISRGPEPLREPGTPPDDCLCGCEGDIESHRPRRNNVRY